jgi:hypothetical protein
MTRDFPLSRFVERLWAHFGHVGSWLTAYEVSGISRYRLQSRLLRLRKSGWSVEPESGAVVRASRDVSRDHFWPSDSEVAIPDPRSFIGVIGFWLSFESLPGDEADLQLVQFSSPGRALLWKSSIVPRLLTDDALAIYFDKTHVDGSPGVSILGRVGVVDLEQLITDLPLRAKHSGADAGRAWSYPQQT